MTLSALPTVDARHFPSPAPTRDPASVLDVDRLRVTYGARVAVDGLSFSVRSGEIFGLLGPNGAGKTSTLSAIEGLITPASGVVHVVGINVREHPLEARANIGVQLQATSFQKELHVAEVIRLYAGLYGILMTDADVAAALHRAGLERFAKIQPGRLSGGERQRLSLAIATLHNPPLLLLDEPTTGLDPHARRQFWTTIEAIRDSGRSVLLTTHSMEEAHGVCDRIAIIDHGRVIATGSPESIIEANRDLPRVRAAARKPEITLEDVFIGLTEPIGSAA